jgi:hypothetical protein
MEPVYDAEMVCTPALTPSLYVRLTDPETPAVTVPIPVESSAKLIEAPEIGLLFSSYTVAVTRMVSPNLAVLGAVSEIDEGNGVTVNFCVILVAGWKFVSPVQVALT